ncbi:MAG: phosphomannomutase, partial [Gemmatimonadales bacterium]
MGKDLTVEAAEAIGLAFAALLTERKIPLDVAVGRDNRPNGVALRDALVAGLVGAGARVVDIGV